MSNEKFTIESWDSLTDTWRFVAEVDRADADAFMDMARARLQLRYRIKEDMK